MTARNALTQLLAATHVVLGAMSGAADAASTTLGEAHLLVLLEAEGAAPMRELQVRSGNKASTLGSMVDRLESRGLAVRHRAETDRRTVVVALTTTGGEVAASIAAALDREATRLAEGGVDLGALDDATMRILEMGT